MCDCELNFDETTDSIWAVQDRDTKTATIGCYTITPNEEKPFEPFKYAPHTKKHRHQQAKWERE